METGFPASAVTIALRAAKRSLVTFLHMGQEKRFLHVFQSLIIILPILTSNIIGGYIINQYLPVLLLPVKPDSSHTIAAIPKAIMPFRTIRCFIVDQKHIRFLAPDFCIHNSLSVFLPDVPPYLILRLPAGEFCPASGPEL